ncbi:MAG: glycosyltransferase, partial [Methanobacteriaceae archaeon]
GFPIGNAEVQIIKLNFKSLKLAGFSPLIINKYSINEAKGRKKLNRIDGIPYVYTSYDVNRPNSFVKRNLNKITGLIGEFMLLIKKKRKIHTAILYTPNFLELIYYRTLSKLFGFKLIIQYVEFRSAIDYRLKSIYKFNDWLFDNYFYIFCDGVIAISEFLKEHVNSRSKHTPVLKLPVVSDFGSFSTSSGIKGTDYLMYCGTIAYHEVIEFIINIFTLLKDTKKCPEQLVMVISGQWEPGWTKLNNILELNNYKKDIIVKSNIKYEELISLYSGAEILLIPLRNNIQDVARFPHKIGEYSASKRPILSNNVGELKYYFKDNESALLVEEYTVKAFVEKLTAVLDSKDLLNKFGEAGYQVGIKYFDYKAQADELKRFILRL